MNEWLVISHMFSVTTFENYNMTIPSFSWSTFAETNPSLNIFNIQIKKYEYFNSVLCL